MLSLAVKWKKSAQATRATPLAAIAARTLVMSAMMPSIAGPNISPAVHSSQEAARGRLRRAKSHSSEGQNAAQQQHLGLQNSSVRAAMLSRDAQHLCRLRCGTC